VPTSTLLHTNASPVLPISTGLDPLVLTVMQHVQHVEMRHQIARHALVVLTITALNALHVALLSTLMDPLVLVAQQHVRPATAMDV